LLLSLNRLVNINSTLAGKCGEIFKNFREQAVLFGEAIIHRFESNPFDLMVASVIWDPLASLFSNFNPRLVFFTMLL
jgi:hypothetical protein